MPNYKYQARSAAGKVSVGVVAAASSADAAQQIRGKGLRVLDLKLAQTAGGSKPLVEQLKQLNAGKPSQKHVLDFTTQLAVMVRAGINLRAALEGIAAQTKHQGFKKIISELKNDVESGKQFSEALARHPKLFSPLYINMVRASEVSGSFARMLQRIAANIAQQIETKKMVVGAMIYPGVIAAMAFGVTIFLLTFVLPRFAVVFQGKEDILPASTTFLLNLSAFLTEQWPAVVGAMTGVVVGVFLALKTEVGKFWFDTIKLAAPLFKPMFRSLYISRSLNTMGELINAGVPMLDTIAITGDISGNQLYKRLWIGVFAAVKEGKKLAHPLQNSSLLPASVVQMIGAGEESGKLGEVLEEVSDFYAKQLKDNIKAVTGMIEPIMIVVMGSIVGFIAMAVILPIFKMSQIVQ